MNSSTGEEVEHRLVDGDGEQVLHLEGRLARSSPRSSHGSSSWRTITRWFATPSTTRLWLYRVA